MKISIMIEGQNGLNWKRWKKLADLVENLGFYGLYRSDHFTNANPPDKDSLELWVSLTYLATVTKRIKFGSLVTPLSFRNPIFTARMASAVDDLSNGRLKLGLGVGWQEREHQIFGFDLLEYEKRFQRFEEGLEVITNLFRYENPYSFEGKYFQVKEGVLLPHPFRKNGPDIIIGGNGKKFTLPMVLKYANEWNTIFLTPDRFKESNSRLNHMLSKQNRLTNEIRRSMMTNLTYARSEVELHSKLKGRKLSEMEERGIIVGQSGQVNEKLQHYQANGCEEIMLQWIDLDDLDGLVDFSEKVLPNYS